MSNNIRPTCINHGCEKPVTSNGLRYRPVCGHCHQAGYGKHPYAEGVTPFKTGKCNNQTGELGWQCPIDYNRSPQFIGMTEIDHIDGNYLNNCLSNVLELCKMCHCWKGRVNGDFKRQNKYSHW